MKGHAILSPDIDPQTQELRSNHIAREMLGLVRRLHSICVEIEDLSLEDCERSSQLWFRSSLFIIFGETLDSLKEHTGHLCGNQELLEPAQ